MKITNTQQTNFLFVSVHVNTNTVSGTAVRCHVMIETGGKFHFLPSLTPRKRNRSPRIEGGNGWLY